MRRVLIAASVMAALAGAAQASERVSVKNVDFRDAAAVKVLYNNLYRAARNACASTYNVWTDTQANDQACVQDTVADTVSKLNHPLLTAAAQQQGQTRTASRGY